MPHPLLRRIFRKVGATSASPPSAESWPELVEFLSRTLKEADQDRYTLERSIDISSREMQGLYQDLQQRSECELAEKRRRLEQTVAMLQATWHASSEGIIVVDEHRRVVFANSRFAEIWRVPDEVMATRDHRQILAYAMTTTGAPVELRGTIEALYTSITDKSRSEIVLADGRIVDRYSAPVQLPDGSFGGRVTYFRDITAERRAQEAIEQGRAAAEAASHAKSMFLANMSHELRTPLNAVIGLADLLLLAHRDPVTARQREYLNGIGNSGRHLLALVNDVLDLAKIEAGRQELEVTRVAPSDVVEAAVAMLQPMAIDRGIALDASTQPRTPDLRADPIRVRQILYNLVSNAVKFTARDGRVRVSAAPDGDHVALSVADTGIGIAPEDLPRLYRPFEQLALPSGNRPAGTGLGLALTKRLVDMHGGAIHVASQLGQGTTFTVTLPTWRSP